MDFIRKVMLTASTYPRRRIREALENYVKESWEHLLNAARFLDIDLIEPIRQTTTEDRKQKKEERTICWEAKMLHGQFVQTKEVGNQDR